MLFLDVCLIQMVHVEDISARKAVLVEIPDALSDNTKSALKSTGISKLYSHQVSLFSYLFIFSKPVFLQEVLTPVIFSGRVDNGISCREECCCGNNDI